MFWWSSHWSVLVAMPSSVGENHASSFGSGSFVNGLIAREGAFLGNRGISLLDFFMHNNLVFEDPWSARCFWRICAPHPMQICQICIAANCGHLESIPCPGIAGISAPFNVYMIYWYIYIYIYICVWYMTYDMYMNIYIYILYIYIYIYYIYIIYIYILYIYIYYIYTLLFDIHTVRTGQL